LSPILTRAVPSRPRKHKSMVNKKWGRIRGSLGNETAPGGEDKKREPVNQKGGEFRVRCAFKRKSRSRNPVTGAFPQNTKKGRKGGGGVRNVKRRNGKKH